MREQKLKKKKERGGPKLWKDMNNRPLLWWKKKWTAMEVNLESFKEMAHSH